MSLDTRVKEIIQQATTPSWDAPIPLVENQAVPAPFPVYAFPGIIQDAIKEVSEFTKAPLAMICSSALNSVSIASQAYVNVSRGYKLTGPSSLFFLTIADPNERKSSVDRLFQESLSTWERERIQLMGEAIDIYRLQEKAYQAKLKGLESAIQEQSKKGRNTDDFEAQLLALQTSKPIEPKIPMLLRVDDTPEALAHGLVNRWPTCGIVSSEGALTLGSHAMGGDSLMRTLGLYNILWDGGTYRAGRISRDDIYLERVRLSVSIMVQEKAFNDFVEKGEGMARGLGLFGRFLTAWPYSTQGTRMITKELHASPALDVFNSAIKAILDMPLPLDDSGKLSPHMAILSAHAQVMWREFSNLMERKVYPGEEFSDTRDVAGKLSENAARSACLLAFFQDPDAIKDDTPMEISEDDMDRGILIASWFGNEARRIFGDTTLAADLALPKKCSQWLVDYCKDRRINSVPERQIRQYGPTSIRKKAVLDDVLATLVQHHHITIEKQGKARMVIVNPHLLRIEL